MDKESIIALQKIDCNCNDCRFMVRDLEKFHSFDSLHEGQEKQGNRINYGDCKKFNKSVSFIPNTFQFETQKCFVHRKDKQLWDSDFCLSHKVGDKYLMKNKNGTQIECKIAYVPLPDFTEERALIEIEMEEGIDFREVPTRFLTKII